MAAKRPRLHLATTSSTTQVQVPNELEEVVNNLVGTVKDLQNTVTLLQDQNAKFQASISQLERDNYTTRQEIKSKAEDLAILQKNTGVLFPLFSKLPAELRR
jgi:septal ring factor EnvC (AmiA/AmiB activator)